MLLLCWLWLLPNYAEQAKASSALAGYGAPKIMLTEQNKSFCFAGYGAPQTTEQGTILLYACLISPSRATISRAHPFPSIWFLFFFLLYTCHSSV
jgi:hypothetical protein